MKLPLFFFLLAAPPAALADPCLSLTINTAAPIHITSPVYASWTIDPSPNRAFFVTKWDDPQLIYLASQIGGRPIRFGGGADDTYYTVGSAPPCPNPMPFGYACLNASTLDALLTFSAESRSPLIFGLTVHPLGPPSPPLGPWAPSNAEALLTYIRDSPFAPSLHALELGNELNAHNVTPAQQAAAFAVLQAALARLWPSPATRPLLVGPDADGAGGDENIHRLLNLAAYMQAFANASAGLGLRLHAATFHEYLQVSGATILNETYLDFSLRNGATLVAAVRGSATPSLPVWAGEIGPHTGDGGNSSSPSLSNCSSNALCGRWASTLWYADSMAAKAASGVDAYFRQDIVGAAYALLNTSHGDFTPTPDFYFLLLWQRLVGRVVLAAAVAPRGEGVRGYAFCAREGSSGEATTGNATALLLLNLRPTPACTALPGLVALGSQVAAWTLTGGAGGLQSYEAELNGALLMLDGAGRLPVMAPARSAASGSLQLPPLSVTLAVVEAGGVLPACSAQLN